MAQQDQIDGPAKLTDLHVLSRPATDKDMRPIIGTLAYSKLTPLEAAFAKKHLEGGSQKYPALVRLEAGRRYAATWLTAETSGRDSTDIDRISKSGGGQSLPGAQMAAIRDLVTIESHMGERDRQIIRMTCGNEVTPAQAIKDICGDYRDTVQARFREALDSLVEAIDKADRNPGRVNLSRHG